MTEYSYVDGIKDTLTDQYFMRDVTENKNYNVIKVKIKEGITEINNPFVDVAKKVNFGVNGEITNTSDSSILYPCGEYVTYFFNKNIKGGVYGTSLTNVTLGSFLSKVDILYNPLPYYFVLNRNDNNNITILNENFEAPNGLFDNPLDVVMNDIVFSGSTFKTAPRIHSDFAMSMIKVYPPGLRETGLNRNFETIGGSFDRWEPFAGCDNIDNIAYQGDLGEHVEFVGPVNFTHNNANNEDTDVPIFNNVTYDNISAYPKMKGECKPKTIIGYIKAGNVKISELPGDIFNFHNDKLNRCFVPYEFDSVEFQNTGNYNLPLLGLNFKDLEMESLHLEPFYVTLNLGMELEDEDEIVDTGDNVNDSDTGNSGVIGDIEDNVDDVINEDNLPGADNEDEESNQLSLKEKSNLTFSLSHLGIEAPKSVKICENLHTLFTVFTKIEDNENEIPIEERKLYFATVDHLKTIAPSWAESLEEIWGELETDENDSPLMPEKVERLQGYYSNILCGYTPYYHKEKKITGLTDSPLSTLIGDFGMFEGDLNYSQVVNHYLKRYPVKDDNYFIRRIPRINLYGNEGIIVEHARNLYAYLCIDEEVFIPKIPENVKFLHAPYYGAFAFTSGLNETEIEWQRKNQKLLIVAESNYSGDGSLKIYKNPTNEYASKFIESVNKSFPRDELMLERTTMNLSDEIWDDSFNDKNTGGVFSLFSKEYSNRVEATYPYEGDDFIEYTDYESLMDTIEVTSNLDITGYFRKFNHPVIFEQGNYSNLKSSSFVQYKCFYNSQVNADIGNIVFSTPDTGYSLKDYDQAFYCDPYEDYFSYHDNFVGYLETPRFISEFPGYVKNFPVDVFGIVGIRFEFIVYYELMDKETRGEHLFNTQSLIDKLPPRANNANSLSMHNVVKSASFDADLSTLDPSEYGIISPTFYIPDYPLPYTMLYFRNDGADDYYELKSYPIFPYAKLDEPVKMRKWSTLQPQELHHINSMMPSSNTYANDYQFNQYLIANMAPVSVFSSGTY